MNRIPDITYVFAALLVIAALHYLAPSESTTSMLQLIVGGLIGIATRQASSGNRTTNVNADVAVTKE